MRLRRSWLFWVGIMSATALGALLCLKGSPVWSTGLLRAFGHLLMLLCLPGLVVDYLGGAANAGPIVYLLNLGVVAVVSGLFWGTLLYLATRLFGRLRRDEASP